MSSDRRPDPHARTKIITQAIKRGLAALTDLPPAPGPSENADRTQLIGQAKPPERVPDAANASSIRGGAKNTKGTMFGQMYSPFAITQEVVKQPGPKPK